MSQELRSPTAFCCDLLFIKQIGICDFAYLLPCLTSIEILRNSVDSNSTHFTFGNHRNQLIAEANLGEATHNSYEDRQRSDQ